MTAPNRARSDGLKLDYRPRRWLKLTLESSNARLPWPPGKMKNRLALTLLAVGLTIQTTANAQATTASQEELARAAFDRAKKQFKSGEYDKAVADFSEFIRLEPDNAVALYNRAVAFYDRGIAYDELKQYHKAIADFTEAISIEPDYAMDFYNRGLVYAELKQYDKAIADFTEAIRLKPDYADAFEHRAAAYEKLGKKEAAANDRKKAKELRGQLGPRSETNSNSKDALDRSRRVEAAIRDDDSLRELSSP